MRLGRGEKMQFEVIPASLDNTDAIAHLTLELGYEVSVEDTRVWLRELIASPVHLVLVAVTGTSVCGWLVIEKRLFLESGFAAEITGLVVGVNFRRQGIAEALVNSAELWGREHGLTRLFVRSNVARDASHAFYPSIGFNLSKTSHVYVKPIDLSH